MKQVLLLLAFLISGTIPQPVYAYQDAVCHVMTSDSISLYVHVKGEGPMCLYLHGGPGSGSTWMEAVSGHMLEKRFTMVYLDQRGVCKSETPKNDDFSFARQIQDWEEVRQALGIDHWLLMGLESSSECHRRHDVHQLHAIKRYELRRKLAAKGHQYPRRHSESCGKG